MREGERERERGVGREGWRIDGWGGTGRDGTDRIDGRDGIGQEMTGRGGRTGQNVKERDWTGRDGTDRWDGTGLAGRMGQYVTG